MNASPQPEPPIAARQNAMQAFSHAAPETIEALYAAFENMPEWDFVRRPETGLVMVRGKIGGGGAPFNLGEMSVTRAAIKLLDGTTGYSYVAGRNQRHAAIAAVFDALWQSEDFRPQIEADIIAPLNAALSENDKTFAAEAAATRVDFFTMVRGDN